MLKRLKTALVDSFVGAIALGWIFAQGITHFVGIFIDPFTKWIAERRYWELLPRNSSPRGFPFQVAILELLYSVFLLLIAYGLLRWLYYPSKKKQHQEQTPEPEQGA
jgi:nitric oxide reductase large subunit